MKYPCSAFKFGRAHNDLNNLLDVAEYIDGVGFLKSMMTYFLSGRAL